MKKKMEWFGTIQMSHQFERFQYAWVYFGHNGELYGRFKMYMRHLQSIRGTLLTLDQIEPFDIYITTISKEGKVLEKICFEF